MKALILSAGQGSRLLPLTEDRPKCLLAINSSRLIELQIKNLIECGINDIAVVVGFRAAAVERFLSVFRRAGLAIRILFNPFFNVADNLASCWIARSEMDRDFVLLNGDTLFEPAVLESLLSAPPAPITLAIDRKAAYDSDDMKVRVKGARLVEVGKTLSSAQVDGEVVSQGDRRARRSGPGPDPLDRGADLGRGGLPGRPRARPEAFRARAGGLGSRGRRGPNSRIAGAERRFQGSMCRVSRIGHSGKTKTMQTRIAKNDSMVRCRRDQ
jgi:choline kinase